MQALAKKLAGGIQAPPAILNDYNTFSDVMDLPARMSSCSLSIFRYILTCRHLMALNIQLF